MPSTPHAAFGLGVQKKKNMSHASEWMGFAVHYNLNKPLSLMQRLGENIGIVLNLYFW